MKFFFAAALALATFVPSALASSPWDGTWKLDPIQSHFEGTSFTYSRTPTAGMMHFSDGGSVFYDFMTDGKQHKTTDEDDTVSATLVGHRTMVLVFRFKGEVKSTVRQELSPNGKRLTEHATGTRPDGTKFDDIAISLRVSGNSGFFGKWKSTTVHMSAPGSYVISTAADGTFTWEIPARQETIVGKADGRPLAITGPTATDGMTLTLRKVSERHLNYAVKLKDKTLQVGHMTISPNGKTLTDVSWAPGKMSEAGTGVFVKQP